MKKLEALRADLKARIADLEQQLIGVDTAIRVLGGSVAEERAARGRLPRANVKQTVLSLLEEVGESGLNAAKAVEIAENRGERIERGTVSSLLSRLKSEGIVEYTGTVYRLINTKRTERPAVDELLN